MDGQDWNGNATNGGYQDGSYQNAGGFSGGNMNADSQNAWNQNNGYQSGNADGYQQGQPYSQGSYQSAPPMNSGNGMNELEQPISMGEWMLTMLILAIPCVNLIMLFVWGFSSSEKKSKSNYCKAYLVWMAISVGLGILFYVVILGGVMAALS